MITYKGKDTRGRARTGSTDQETPGELTERLLAAAWQSLRVYRGVTLVGEIAYDTETHSRTWWAER